MAEPVPVDDISAVSYRFAVKWSVPAEKLRYQHLPPGEKTTPIIIKSNTYRFKDVKNFEFSLHLTCTQNDTQSPHGQIDYKMAVNCTLGLPIFLEDVLILIDGGIFRVLCEGRNNIGKRLIFNSMILARDKFTDENVTFRCVMSVPVKVKAVISNPLEDPSTENIVDCEAILCDPGVYPNGYDDVSEFLFSSRIPDFNVDMAARMMREAKLREIPILKALCIEYLMENLTTENVTWVLQHAVDSDAKDLSRICVHFLSECKITKVTDFDSSFRSNR